MCKTKRTGAYGLARTTSRRGQLRKLVVKEVDRTEYYEDIVLACMRQ